MRCGWRLPTPYDMEGIDFFRRIAGRDAQFVVASEPDILKALTEFYGLRHSVKKAERDLNSGIDLGNPEQLSRMKSTEIESSDQGHVVNAVEQAPARLREPRRYPHRAQARREPDPLPHRRRAARHPACSVVHAAVTSRVPCPALDMPRSRPAGRRVMSRGGRESAAPLPPSRLREVGDAHLRSPGGDAGSGGLSFYPDELSTFNIYLPPGTAPSWSSPHRLGKTTTYSALGDHLHARDQRHHDRGSDRDGLPGLQPDRGAAQRWTNFMAALRYILRQDPDVIMVGEIRYNETAQYFIQAALTGHRLLHPAHQRRLDLAPGSTRRRAP